MISVSFYMAFLMGLTGSLHCAGMCGPIMLIMPFQRLTGYSRWLGIFLYHFGRASVYALMGFVLFSFKEFFHPEWQQLVSIVLGALLLTAGLLSFLIPGNFLSRMPWSGAVQSSLNRFVAHPSPAFLFITGALNGLLPCGLVYMALTMAVSAHTIHEALIFMYTFAAGTTPMLVFITLSKARARFFKAAGLRKWVPMFMLLLGALFVVRGLNLGIPYLSPKVVMDQHAVSAECCSKH